MDATLFVVLLVVAIFAGDMLYRRWRENEWKRRWKRGSDGDKIDSDDANAGRR